MGSLTLGDGVMEDEDGMNGGHDDRTAVVVVDYLVDKKDPDSVKENATEVVNRCSRKFAKFTRRIERSLTKPSYTLTLGPTDVRQKNRGRLRYLLYKLVRGHNWKEASGVLSTLLKGTCRERSLLNNRMKYWVAMELLSHLESDNIKPNKIKNIFHLWRNKVGSIKKDLYVQLEFIIYCLTQGDLDEAHQAAVGLMSEAKCERDPLSNLVLGLTFFQLWYTKLPEEIKLSSFDVSCVSEELETSSVELHEPVKNQERDHTISANDLYSQLHSNSEASIRNDKHFSMDFNDGLKQEVVENDTFHNRDRVEQLQPQVLSLNTVEMNEEEEGSLPFDDATKHPSVFFANGIHPSLLPLKLPDSDENIEEFLSFYDGFFNDHYNRALQCLDLAITSTPPLSEALLPLIQLLLLRDQLEYALNVLRNFCPIADTTLPFRIRAHLVECFHCGTYAELRTCYEAIMKMDPTCKHSVKRLLMLTKIGEYEPHQLLEMIALHLEATYADSDIWKEFASCLLKISQSEEDTMSTCTNGEGTRGEQGSNIHLSRIPAGFTVGITGKNWELRCKWWLKRHFSNKILASEMKAGEIQLMVSKAACACHFYGPESEYVVEVSAALRDSDDESMLMFLQMHIAHAIGLCSHLFKKCTPQRIHARANAIGGQ
ncbi:hypothetical protein Dimus_012700 [Dionaea muscipula]